MVFIPKAKGSSRRVVTGRWEVGRKPPPALLDSPRAGLLFLLTSPHPEALQETTLSPLMRIKDAPVTQEIPRSFVSGTGFKDQILEQKMLLALFHLGNTGFRSSARSQGQI